MKNAATKAWAVVILGGLGLWGFKFHQTWGAFRVAEAQVVGDARIIKALGPYTAHFDWWSMAWRTPWENEVKRFDFTLKGRDGEAVGSVEVEKDGDWQLRCLHVVNGPYANRLILGGCLST